MLRKHAAIIAESLRQETLRRQRVPTREDMQSRLRRVSGLRDSDGLLFFFELTHDAIMMRFPTMLKNIGRNRRVPETGDSATTECAHSEGNTIPSPQSLGPPEL